MVNVGQVMGWIPRTWGWYTLSQTRKLYGYYHVDRFLSEDIGGTEVY